MLSQINLWTERAGMVLDVVLMLRILTLRLHRTYLFVTLFALLSLFYDGVEVLLGSQSDSFVQVILLSRFIYAIVFPLAIWDLFEEARPLVDKVRRMAMSRMISSLLFISLWGLLIAAFTGGDDGNQSHYMARFAFVAWTGTVAAALAFLWVMKKAIKANQWQLPRNTEIWVRFFQLLLVIEAVSCALDLLLPSLKAIGSNLADTIGQVSEPVLQVCAAVLTGWCVFNLRAVPSNAENVPADVKP
jgi:uncharacterized Tic20 family protein